MKSRKNKRIRVWSGAAIVILFAFWAGACAGVDKEPVLQKMAKADSAINDAQQANAASYAPLEIKLAEEKLSNARNAFQKEDYRQADWMAEEALADANLAESKARSSETRQTVQELQDTIQNLQQEIQSQQQ